MGVRAVAPFDGRTPQAASGLVVHKSLEGRSAPLAASQFMPHSDEGKIDERNYREPQSTLSMMHLQRPRSPSSRYPHHASPVDPPAVRGDGFAGDEDGGPLGLSGRSRPTRIIGERFWV